LPFSRRPRATRRILLPIAFLTAVTALAGAPAPAAAVDGAEFASVLNGYRADVASPPVVLDAAIDGIAVERGNELAAAQEVSHDFEALKQRFAEEGVCWRAFGEIVARNGSGEVGAFLHQWDTSPTHHAVMLNPRYTSVGGSWSRGSDGRAYGVMIFVETCGPRPATGGFLDIGSSPFRSDIAWLVRAEITAGCRAGHYCPRAAVTREQMASFLGRADKLAGAQRDWFVDDNSSAHESDINRVAEASIAAGCADARYCPRSGVTRGQMASFLARTRHLPAATRDWFGDDNGTTHEGAINRVAEAGITGGCAAGRYCPDAPVTREQMAAFLHRAFGN